MCLGIPGKVVETYLEDEILMGKVDFGGISGASAWSTSPRSGPTTTWWSTSASPSLGSTRRRLARSSPSWSG